MAVVDFDICLYGSNSMPDDDTATNIGGAIATSKKPMFSAITVNQTMQYISSAAGDTTQTVTVSYLDTSNALQTEVKTLNGTTAVAGSATMKTLLKGIKSATTTGDVAVESTTAIRSNTATAGAAATITLDAGASAVDDFYKGNIIRTTGGTGPNQIREIISYVGATKVASVSRGWGTNPDATTTFRIAQGFLFDKLPAEITEVRRPFFNAQANATGGATKTYYDKIFIKNTNSSSGLTTASVLLSANPASVASFALETAVDGTGTNGVGNTRLIAPASLTFDGTTKAIPGNALAAGITIGVWCKLTLTAGLSPNETTFTLGLQGVV